MAYGAPGYFQQVLSGQRGATNWSPLVYSFPSATITNFHKPGGLKEQKCSLSHFRRPESQTDFYWTKIKMSVGQWSFQRL